jgi:hypothetical protein
MMEEDDENNKSKTNISKNSGTHVKSLAKEIKLFKKSRKMYFFTKALV